MFADNVVWGWDPAAELRRLQNDMNRVFRGIGYGEDPFPALNVYSSEDEVTVTAELPGVAPEDLAISVNGNRLSVEGERRAEEPGSKVVCHRRERGAGRFARTLLLPFDVEAGKVAAASRNGILTVRLPRAETAKPRKIEITAG